MIVTLESISRVNDMTYEFTFTPEQRLDYTAGQFVELTLSHLNPDSRGIRRWFTLSSAPEETVLRITTKRHDKMSSFKTALFSMHTGDRLEISQAMGDFVLPRQLTIPVLFVVAGIGITPVRSIVKSLSAAEVQRDIQVLYISRESQPAYVDEILAYTSLTYVYQPHETIAKVIPYVVAATEKQPNLQVYISGPERFVEEIQSLLRDVIKPGRLSTDFFHGYN